MKKVIKISLIMMFLMMFFVTTAYGFGVNDITGNASASGVSDLETKGKNIVSVITTIGIVVSVIAIAALGLKYMMGSVEERAEYKKTLVPYLIGAALVFGASTIAEIIYLFVK